MALAHQTHHHALTAARQQAAQLEHDQIPVAHQIEAHHRYEQQVADPCQQGQPRRGGSAQHHGEDVGGAAQVCSECGLQLIETPEVVFQPELRLHPGQRLMLQPVQRQRRQLVELHQLLAEHRQQHQQHQQHQQTEQGEYDDHPPGTRQPPALQAIDQRISEIGQQDADEKRGEDRRQQIYQPGAQEHACQPEPAVRIVHGHSMPSVQDSRRYRNCVITSGNASPCRSRATQAHCRARQPHRPHPSAAVHPVAPRLRRLPANAPAPAEHATAPDWR